MSSIMTNAGAMVALQNLKATNKALDTTQNRISTGFRVGQASDNAAYWSIATTMRSDNKAMSTVQDALGLGAAQVDVAYTAMEEVRKTLDEMKAKVVAASQPNIDKSKIQEEIRQLQNDLQTYAKSASFSRGNWLDVNETSVQKVVASFNRDESGAITLGTIDVDTSKVALYVRDGSGLLQGAIDLTGEAGTAPDVSGLAADGASTVPGTGTNQITVAGFADLDWAAGDSFSFTVDIDGTETTINGTFDGDAWSWADEPLGISVALGGQDLVVTIADDAGTDGDAVSIGGFASARPEASGGTAIAGVSDISGGTGTIATASATAVTVAGFSGIQWQEGDSVTFAVAVPGENGGDPYEITGTFSETSGWSFSGQPGELTIAVNGSGELTVTADAGFGTDTGTMTVGSFAGARPADAADVVNVSNFDLTNFTPEEIERLMNHVDAVLSRVTTAASDLGAIKNRITQQSTFVSNLMDAVNRGVGQLVDADMTEESTRLQALQVQQQLGIQALSIANGNSQMILALFN